MSLPRRLVCPPPSRGAPDVVARVDDVLRPRLQELGVDPTVRPTFLLASALLVALVVGGHVAGPTGVAVSMLVVLVGPVAASALIGPARRRRHRLDALPDLCTELVRALRSGTPPLEAMASMASSSNPGASVAARQIRVGRDPVAALSEWQERSDTEAERLLSTALLFGLAHGGDLAGCVDVVGESLREDRAVERRRWALTAQARLSAGVLAALPLVFAVVASMIRGAPIHRGGAGAVLGGAGLVLDAIGFAWMHRLGGRLE